MPLLGKIVVIKRNGEDGTEFPLTASCLFGRKLNCDIRIQLPQVSKEHCRIELNENKELILTNLSSVNPTLMNGEALLQAERLKHGDLITIIDRSFRFEYPPPKTPKKKRLSTIGQDKTPQVCTPVLLEKRKSEYSFETCLKDGSNLPQSLEQTVETTADEKPKKDSMSPFGELCQIVKQDLATKSPWKSGLAKTPLSRPPVHQTFTSDVKSDPKPVTTPSAKSRRSSKHSFDDQKRVDQSLTNATLESEPSVESSTPSKLEKSGSPVSQKKRTPSKTPEKLSTGDVVQQILLEAQPEEKTSKSPKRRSDASQDQSLVLQMPSDQTPAPEEKNQDIKMSPRTSPRANAGKRFQVQDVLSEIKADKLASQEKDGNSSHADVTLLKSMRKRVSFGGQLSPELFDKRLPPNSPLRRGATPRRSLGPSQKSQSLLRRASTIGLLALRLKETVPEGTKAQKSPAKKASPKHATKTPSPAKRSPRAKTPSPKPQKCPSGPSSTTTSPKTPASTRKASTSLIEASGNGSSIETPKVQGRFSISRISTPSPVQDQVDESKEVTVEEVPRVSGTPKIPLRRKSMKSARKTPKSSIKNALDVIRSRRSGASRANLKVLNSWADIVKFGQAKPKVTDVATQKKTAKSSIVKRTVVPKPKTPARRLKDEISTGHAMSPVTIVVGKAHLRSNQSVGAAPKIVSNLAVFKKDMKMDEDLTGISDIFKTPANKSMNTFARNNAHPGTPMDEFSVMKTPEESGEMMVSPLSVVSTAKHDSYSNEAVTRLLLENQDDSLFDHDAVSQPSENSNDTQESAEMAESDQTKEEESVTKVTIKTPKQAAAPSSCLTGVKRLLRTPKQRAEPIEDLRGKLLKTPKHPKVTPQESLEGVKELLKTPKHRGLPVEDMYGIKRLMKTPKVKFDQCEDLTGVEELMKTPKEKSGQHEDLTEEEQLMITPKEKSEQHEDLTEEEQLMITPKEKSGQHEDLTEEEQLMIQPNEKSEQHEDLTDVEVMEKPLEEEDLTGLKQLMKTPKHRGKPVENHLGLKRLMQTPKDKKVQHLEDLTGVKQLMKTPKQKQMKGEEDFTGVKELEESESSSTQNGVTVSAETQEPVQAINSYAASTPSEDFDEVFDKENVCSNEPMETEVVKSMDPLVTAGVFDEQLKTEDVVPQKELCDQPKEELVSVSDICPSEGDEKTKEQSKEPTFIYENSCIESTPPSCTDKTVEEELTESALASKPQQSGRSRTMQKSKTPAVQSIIEESSLPPPSPGRGRRGKKLIEIPEIVASPVRKSARGRVTKLEVEEVVQAPGESINTDISDCQSTVSKKKIGRKTQKEVAEPVEESKAVDVECSNLPEPVQTAVPKAGRRKMNHKMESQPLEEPQHATETVCEENAVTTQSASVETSEVPEALITATKTRRGRPPKKENLKNETTISLESDKTKTHIDVVSDKPPAKSCRGRMSKKEMVNEQSLGDESPIEVPGESQVEPEALVMKSVRGRRTKQQKPQIPENVDKQDDVDASTHVPAVEVYPQVEVKSVRRGRTTKQSKDISIDVEENVVCVEAEVPIVKSNRKRPAVKEAEAVSEVPVKRGRRAAVDPKPTVAIVSVRGRKTVAKAEPEVQKEVTSSKAAIKPIKPTRRTTKVSESTKKDATQAVESDVNTLPHKVGRGIRGKKEKGSTKDTVQDTVNESETAKEDSYLRTSKTVNWSADLVTSKNIEEFEPSTDVKEAQLKKSKKLDKSSAKTESKQSTDLPHRVRRGRAARKEEGETPVEDRLEESQETAKPSRKGKAATAAVYDGNTSTPLKRKRNEVLEAAEDLSHKEPLPKRRGRIANSTEVVSSKEKSAEPILKTSKRTTRGLKTAKEPDPAPVPAQESSSGTSTRKGRGVKKAEVVEISEAAPVRRTRRN